MKRNELNEMKSLISLTVTMMPLNLDGEKERRKRV